MEWIGIHDKAVRFLDKVINDRGIRIAMSTYQVAEIMEVLRRSRVPKKIIERIMDDF